MAEDVNLGDFDPEWTKTGGISGGEERDYEQDDTDNWDTRARSWDVQQQDDTSVPTCGAPDTGTWIWGAIDGECQWIDTTTC